MSAVRLAHRILVIVSLILISIGFSSLNRKLAYDSALRAVHDPSGCELTIGGQQANSCTSPFLIDVQDMPQEDAILHLTRERRQLQSIPVLGIPIPSAWTGLLLLIGLLIFAIGHCGSLAKRLENPDFRQCARGFPWYPILEPRSTMALSLLLTFGLPSVAAGVMVATEQIDYFSSDLFIPAQRPHYIWARWLSFCAVVMLSVWAAAMLRSIHRCIWSNTEQKEIGIGDAEKNVSSPP